MRFHIDQRSPREGVTVISVQGDSDLFTSPKLREAMAEALDRGTSRLVIDLSESSALDSTALGVLVGGKKRAMAKGGDVRLVCPSERTRRIFVLTALDAVFKITGTVEEALAGF